MSTSPSTLATAIEEALQKDENGRAALNRLCTVSLVKVVETVVEFKDNIWSSKVTVSGTGNLEHIQCTGLAKGRKKQDAFDAALVGIFRVIIANIRDGTFVSTPPNTSLESLKTVCSHASNGNEVLVASLEVEVDKVTGVVSAIKITTFLSATEQRRVRHMASGTVDATALDFTFATLEGPEHMPMHEMLQVTDTFVAQLRNRDDACLVVYDTDSTRQLLEDYGLSLSRIHVVDMAKVALETASFEGMALARDFLRGLGIELEER